ncbi:MAG: hypothetical protein K6U88_08115 [Dehalococcoidia bacterium]|nr:hypothetical protein [Dehalococcoidia bacterium]
MTRWPAIGSKIVLAVVAAVAAAGVAACSGGDSASTEQPAGVIAQQPAGSIRVDLRNWAVVPEVASAPAGKVTFWAVHDMEHMHGQNEGGAVHDLQVMKKLPSGEMELIGQVQGLKMGEAKALTLELQPGEYELSCNVVEEVGGKTISHYKEGMVASFTVTR